MPPRDPHPPAVHHKWPTPAVIFQPHPPTRGRRETAQTRSVDPGDIVCSRDELPLITRRRLSLRIFYRFYQFTQATQDLYCLQLKQILVAVLSRLGHILRDQNMSFKAKDLHYGTVTLYNSEQS